MAQGILTSQVVGSIHTSTMDLRLPTQKWREESYKGFYYDSDQEIPTTEKKWK